VADAHSPMTDGPVAPAGTAPFAGRTVLVAGVGLAGDSAARALLAEGARVLLTDRVRAARVEALEEQGARFVGAGLDELPAGVDLLWVTPGMAPSNPLPVAARAAGVEVIGEAELAWRLRGPSAAPWLAITGTNGKTTTVRMLAAMLDAAGWRTAAVGNVGVSLIDAVRAGPRYDVLAVELSSFQLYWSSSLRPAAGALLNLAPDHLDWHGAMDDYIAAKTKIWAGPVAIGNLDDPRVARLLSRAPGRRVGFTLGAPGAGEFGIVSDSLTDRAFAEWAEMIKATEIRPPGAHNAANALAAAALARSFGAPAAAVAGGLRAFVPDPHRNQLVGVWDGVRYVDDSKATNPHAAAASLAAYRPVVWIAGGQLKGAPVEELVVTHRSRLAGVVLLGVDRAVLAAALARHAPDVPVVDVPRRDDGAMSEVVAAAIALARPGDTVLLAPAAASYDMFTNYAGRGDLFAAAVAAAHEPGAR